jgi:FkbM family methyltransferase
MGGRHVCRFTSEKDMKIVEIGTSDFRTDAGKVDGLFIEPVKEYFDRLPECRKENVAISNKEGFIDLFYIPSAVIAAEGLPNWVRGCNSVGKPHDTVVNQGWGKYLKHESVRVERIKTLIDKYGITKIEHLKIDTEGHDCIILNDFLDTCDIKPKKITFEANVLSSVHDVKQLVRRLSAIGYKCNQVKFDMVCEL